MARGHIKNVNKKSQNIFLKNLELVGSTWLELLKLGLCLNELELSSWVDGPLPPLKTKAYTVSKMI